MLLKLREDHDLILLYELLIEFDEQVNKQHLDLIAKGFFDHVGIYESQLYLDRFSRSQLQSRPMKRR